MPGLPTVL